MEVRWLTVVLDTPAGMAQAEQFWQWVTGTVPAPRRGERAEFATLAPPDGDAFVQVRRVESGDARCHLGLHVDDVRAALAHPTEPPAPFAA